MVAAMQRDVVSAGGRASTLMGQLAAAAAYLRAGPEERRRAPEELFTAFRRVAGGDLDGPDWRMHGDDAEQEEIARAALASDLTKRAKHVGIVAHDMLCAWQSAAEKEVSWRERQEAGRSVLRVVMRSWHEAAEGVKAGRAEWQQSKDRSRAGSGECKLARKLQFRDGACWRDDAWATKFVLTWYRLVHAGEVAKLRRQSALWQQQRAAYNATLYYSVQPHAAW